MLLILLSIYGIDSLEYSFSAEEPPIQPWAPGEVPEDNWSEFFTFYQRFLRERLPRAVRTSNDKARDHAKRIENHRELAATLEKLSQTCNRFAHSEKFPAFANPKIKKEMKNRIPGTWNFYRNVPPNKADLWQESCHLRFSAMLHETELEFDRLDQINEYAEELSGHKSLENLYCHIKRTWYAKTLDRIARFGNRKNIPCDPRLNEKNAGVNTFYQTLEDFRTFAVPRFGRENVELLERFVLTAEKCRAEKTDILLKQILDELEHAAQKHYTGVYSDPAAKSTEKAKSAELLDLVQLDQGLFRRRNLLGQELRIWGCDMNSQTFDADSLNGKVVLVDFWATWCGPCVAEFANLKILYEKYHEKGFEIIGYNVDTDLEALAGFLEEKPLPWPVLVREKTLHKGELPMSTFYGAKKLPVVLLRDRQGRTILLNARGKTLEETLERIFQF